jgi:hypothetical protein
MSDYKRSSYGGTDRLAEPGRLGNASAVSRQRQGLRHPDGDPVGGIPGVGWAEKSRYVRTLKPYDPLTNSRERLTMWWLIGGVVVVLLGVGGWLFGPSIRTLFGPRFEPAATDDASVVRAQQSGQSNGAGQ